MSTQQLGLLAIAAILVFWMVGAYNRLTAQRSAIGQAWERIEEALHQRAGAAEPLAMALALPLAAEHGALQAWAGAQAEAATAAANLAAKPVSERCAAAWAAAEAALAAASSRVFALLDQHADLAGDEAVAPWAAAWREGQGRLPFARQLFNDAVDTYNEAAAAFPTRLVVLLFGLHPAGRV